MIEKTLMTSQEAADYLGIKRSYLYKMTMRRFEQATLPCTITSHARLTPTAGGCPSMSPTA